jgi:hypothetical protein
MEEVSLTPREMLRRIDALGMGGPINRFQTKHVQIQANPIICAFIRVTGDNKPWAIAYGRAQDQNPRVSIALNPFSLDDFTAMVAPFAQWVADEVGIPSVGTGDVLPYQNIPADRIPQFWFPDESHFEMLRLLSYATFADRKIQESTDPIATLGRFSEFLTEIRNYKGQQMAHVASEVLNHLWVVPADDFSLGHLGFMNAWIEAKGGIAERRKAAREASKDSVNVTLDAPIDVKLAAGIPPGAVGVLGGETLPPEAVIERQKLLDEQVSHRWKTAQESWRLAKNDPRPTNEVIGLIMMDTALALAEYLAHESRADGVAKTSDSPRGDANPLDSSLKYLKMLKAEEKFLCWAVHDDKELLADTLAGGLSFIATVKNVEKRIVEDKEYVFWQLQLNAKYSQLLKLRESETYAIFGSLWAKTQATLVGYTAEGGAVGDGTAEAADSQSGNWILTMRWSADERLDRVNKTLSADLPHPFNHRVSESVWVDREIVFVPAFAEHLFETAYQAAKASKFGKGKWIHDLASEAIETPSEIPERTVLSGVDPSESLINLAADTLLAAEEHTHIIRAAPGSGKSRALLRIAKRFLDEGMLVAIATQTNNQALDLCAKWQKEFPQQATSLVRFASTLIEKPKKAKYGWVTDSNLLPETASLVVSTAAKWGQSFRVNNERNFFVVLVDEAYQMPWSTFLQVSNLAPRFALIGDAGQIPPVVPVDARRWETSPVPPHWSSPETFAVRGSSPKVSFDSLDVVWRLPFESIEYIKGFYDDRGIAVREQARPRERELTFTPASGSDPHTAGIHKAKFGLPVVFEIDNDENGPPLDRDLGIASEIREFILTLFRGNPTCKYLELAGGEWVPQEKDLELADIAICSTKRATNALIEKEVSKALLQLKAEGNRVGYEKGGIKVDTPERLQGLERRVFIAVHPLTNVTHPSEFDLETGRLCVMASRHQNALFIFSRSHVRPMLDTANIVSGHAPSRRDLTGHGVRNHKQFLDDLAAHQNCGCPDSDCDVRTGGPKP